ncbi:hypothetical protein GEMRC1_006988 [Eukaryota sp. GEM-RC1]
MSQSLLLHRNNPALPLFVSGPGIPRFQVSNTSIYQSENVSWTSHEIFDLIKDIQDPELPQTLGELDVVREERIIIEQDNTVTVNFTPTVPHCSMATFIGLAIRVKLLHCLPLKFKILVRITEGTHDSADAINKQLADKERVAAAIENPNLKESIDMLIS